MEKKCDCLVIGYDMSGDDVTCLMVASKHGRGLNIINALYGKEAEKIYEALTVRRQYANTEKAELTL